MVEYRKRRHTKRKTDYTKGWTYNDKRGCFYREMPDGRKLSLWSSLISKKPVIREWYAEVEKGQDMASVPINATTKREAMKEAIVKSEHYF